MHRLTRMGVPVALALAGLAGGALLVASGSSEAARAPATEAVRPVRVVQVTAGEVPLVVERTGVVQAVAQVQIPALVGGPVVWVADGLRAGVEVEAGQALARIDRTAFDSQLAEARTRVANAEQAVALEAGRGEVARLEHDLIGTEVSSVVLREPQRIAAEAELDAARFNLTKAEKDWARATLRAPFAGRLTDESLELGAYLPAGGSVATLVGGEVARIEVAVPLDVADQLAVPGLTGDAEGHVAFVDAVGSDVQRRGQVVGSTGQVDATTRMVTLQVDVADPFDAELGVLLPGTFVEVSLVAEPFADAIAVPASALVNGPAVWVADPEDRAARAEVEVLWRDGERVILRGDFDLETRVLADPPPDLLDGTAVAAQEVAS